MGEDWSQAAISQAGETFGELSRYAVVTKFHQQIIGVANGVRVRMFENAFQILERKMKVAAQTELQRQRGIQFLPQLPQKARQIRAIVSVAIIGVRRRHGVSNSEC